VNIFRKIIKEDNENEKKAGESEGYQSEPELEEELSSENNNQKDDTDYPNPELFRRLIEGTSFDRRTEILPEKQATNKEDEQTIPKKPKYNQVVPEITNKKIHETKPCMNKSDKKKKFINKERENKLGNIVNEVLGHSQKQKNQNP